MFRCRNLFFTMSLVCTLAGSAACEENIKWAPNLSAAINMAARQNQLVLIHFWAPGCRPCLALEHNVFNRPEVANAIAKDFVPVKINAEAMPDTARKYEVDRWPMDVIITPAGYQLHSMVSPQDPRKYTQALYRVVAQRRPGNRLSAAAQQSPSPTTAGSAQGQNGWGESSPYQPSGNNWNTQANRFAEFGRAAEPAPESAGSPPRGSAGPQNSHGTFPGNSAGLSSREDQFQPRHNAAGESRFGPSYANRFHRADSQDAQHPSQQQATPSQPQQTVNPYITDQARVGSASPAPRGPQAPPEARPQRQGRKLPPLGLEGYCPVTLIKEGSWTKGDKRFGVIHRGRLYLFATEAAKHAFWQDPDRFAPILSGNDPVKFAESGQVAPGSRKHGVFFRDQIYLFVSEESLERFWNSPQRYSDIALQAMRRASENIRR